MSKVSSFVNVIVCIWAVFCVDAEWCIFLLKFVNFACEDNVFCETD